MTTGATVSVPCGSDVARPLCPPPQSSFVLLHPANRGLGNFGATDGSLRASEPDGPGPRKLQTGQPTQRQAGGPRPSDRHPEGAAAWGEATRARRGQRAPVPAPGRAPRPLAGRTTADFSEQPQLIFRRLSFVWSHSAVSKIWSHSGVTPVSFSRGSLKI